MKKLVVYLEIGVLFLSLVILLLSAIERKETTAVVDLPPSPDIQVDAFKPEEPQISLPSQLVDQTAPAPEQVTDQIPTLQPAGSKVRPGSKKIEVGLSRPTVTDNSPPGGSFVIWKKEQWQGDFNAMRRRRVVRVLVPFSRTFFFLDHGHRRGLIFDALNEYEKYLNKSVKNRSQAIHVNIIPTPRNRLFTNLVAGYGDIAAGNLTITPQREKIVDFVNPSLTNVSEIIVAGPEAPVLKTIFDLAGREIIVRKSSSYYESLLVLNNTLQSIGKKPVDIVFADEYLEDEDLLEMVNANLVPLMIIDSHKGRFWAKIFKNIKLYPDIKLRTGGEIAWAIRKNSLQLKKNINGFVQTIKKGTLTGNILFQRYLQNTGYIKNSLSKRAMQGYNRTIDLFKKYADKYDFPYLMLTALAFQESGLDQSQRSHAGAVGIMQILPSTAADKNVGIRHIDRLENNIHAGTRYLRFMADRYFGDPKLTTLNRDLFTIAAYNAGPARITKLRKEATRRGLDANVWFNNVEVIASERIGRETVQYVRNIYKYYVAYEYIIKNSLKKEVGTAILKAHLKSK